MSRSPSYWIDLLRLTPHPEGGFFTETYRSALTLSPSALPPSFPGERVAGTAIYYLLTAGTYSRLHRLRADEVWHHYDGGTLRISMIHPDGTSGELLLGKEEGAMPQCMVPAGVWFGARPVMQDTYVLAGCTMAPGFHFDDFEMGDRDTLLAQFPAHRQMIESLTPERF